MLRRFLARAALATLAIGLLPASRGQAQDHAHTHSAPAPAVSDVPLYDNLGSHHYAISSRVPRVQEYFDQGLRLYYAFNHAESVRAFAEAARRDDACAMCYWGIALAHGPNINAPLDSASGVAAYTAIERARERSPQASAEERALIDALAVRYAADPLADRASLDSAYARALAEVVRRYPDNREAAVLYAEALMDLRPWSYWTRTGEPEPGTSELLAMLERVIAADPQHPGACHFYIHAVEAAYPERAVPCAERLAQLMPGAGHLVHMPGHIYIRVGRYMDAIRANEHAVHADESYIQDQRPGVGIYTAGYYPHNYDFMAFASAMAGRAGQSLGAAAKVRELVPAEMLDVAGMTYLQQFVMRPMQFRVRFGRWQEILAEPEPAAGLLHARGLWHYARGRAFLAHGDEARAQAELARLAAITADPALEGVHLEFNDALTVLLIARHVLAGVVAAASGAFDAAIAELRTAADIEDGLTYGEPPEWPVPVRHDLGAVLLAAGRPADAETAYREDLRRFPANGWSLTGLAVSLEQQGRAVDAARVRTEATNALNEADVKLSASRF